MSVAVAPQHGSELTIGASNRQAKGLALELKGMLKRKDPWDREVEIQRDSYVLLWLVAMI